MSRDAPLNLTNSQYRLVSQAAQSLPPQWQSRFKASVSDLLMGLQHRLISDQDVFVACDTALKRMAGTGFDDGGNRCGGCCS
jgi:hypothetical protein